MNVKVPSSTADSSGSYTVCETVVTAVADAENASPLDLRPLATVIDPDALSELVDSMAGSSVDRPGTVTFSYCGYAVTVAEDESVSVEVIDGESRDDEDRTNYRFS